MNYTNLLPLLLFVVAAFFNPTHTQENSGYCTKDIDLVFALDASGSVGEEGYEQIKRFAKGITDQFQIAATKTHVAIVTFSEYGEVQLKLTDSFDKNEIFNRIDNLDYPGYRTATDDALRVLDQQVFSLSGGMRQGAAQVLIFLTDGKCTLCEQSVESAVAPIKERGVTIYTVGVTDKINKTELEVIASEPPRDHSFEVAEFDELAGIIVDVYTKACDVKIGKCRKPLTPFECTGREEDECIGDGECDGTMKCCSSGCSNKCTFPLLNCLTAVDVAFALDSSKSVRDEAFIDMKNFAKDIVDSFVVSQKEARFASLIYSNDAEVSFDFVRHASADKIKRAIDALPHKKSDTRVDKALELAASDIFSLQGGVRSRRPMVLIVFFDGDVSKDMGDLERFAAPLKEYGVKIVAVGVGPEVNTYQLAKIATSSNVIFKARDFDTLLPELYTIAEETCSEKPGECPVPTSQPCAISALSNVCESDFDCNGASKCCQDKCGSSVCVGPTNICKRKVDIAFAVHQNANPEEFQIMKHFVEQSLLRFEINQDRAHAALISYGKDPTVVFDFNDPQDVTRRLFKEINLLQYNPGQGTLVDVLATACDRIFCKIGGTRPDVPKMLVVLTAPHAPSNDVELNRRIKTLQQRGVDVLFLAVGDDVDVQTLQRVTSPNAQVIDRVLLADSFANLVQYGRDIPEFACSEAGSVKPSVNETCVSQPYKPPTHCVKGAKGTRGQHGIFGKRGQPGVRGKGGNPGIRGPQGDQGDDGRRGPAGPEGAEGLIGLPGYAGFNGIPGVPGVQGRPGRDGGCGLPGRPGEAGTAGVAGFSGPPGYKGPAGPKGAKGQPAVYNPDLEIERGDDGDPGENGFLGLKGMKGDEGMLGMPGEDGEDGSIGLDGEDGDAGEPGLATSFVKGEKGLPGDFGPPGKPGLVWSEGCEKGKPCIANITESGDKGIKGVAGDRGQPGYNSDVNGIQGANGDKGLRGDPGMDAEEGIAGMKGSKGEEGIKGVNGQPGDGGRDGFRGFPGLSGEDGPAGKQGNKGKRGRPGEPKPPSLGQKGQVGDAGRPGFSGFPGLEGPEGSQGPDGDEGSRGFPGEFGRTGQKGGEGAQGEKGPDGEIGDIGFKGISGEQGAKGEPASTPVAEVGDKGEAGPKGEAGIIGLIGPPGYAGPRGPVTIADCGKECPVTKGFKGQQGDNGQPGDRGPAGPEGRKGFPAEPCPTCPPGPSGISGVAGFPGKVGFKGRAGSDGDPGMAGVKGVMGPKGAVGEPGINGKAGDKGEPGQIGAKGPDADGLSVAERGEKGNPGSDGLNGKRGADGKAGERGRKGAAGEPGKRGEMGAKGNAGLSGEAGANGKDGKPGQKGEEGETVRGEPGLTGDEGEEGVMGLFGEPGQKGKKGERGSEPNAEQKEQMKKLSPGEKGIQGPDGDAGEPGIEGPKGVIGPGGIQGPEGDKGERGPGGVKGEVGPKGQTGDDGDPGTAGVPGRFGRRGLPGDAGKPGLPGDSVIKGQKGERGEAGPEGKRGVDASAIGCINVERIDIAFLIDSSRSVTQEDFQRQKEFIREIVSEFPVGPEKSLVGVIKYGMGANVEIRFSDYTDEKMLLERVDRLQHSAATESRLDEALQLAQDRLFTREAGARIGDKKTRQALVILGDGYLSGGGLLGKQLSGNALTSANQIKARGTLVFSLAVGTEKNRYLLQRFVSDDNYYLDVPTYSFLSQKIEDLKIALSRSSGCVTETQKGEPGRNNTVKGKPGDRGVQGVPGPPGIEGPEGFIGNNGPKGYRGSTIPGQKGEQGYEGLNGVKGEPGMPGLNGEYVKGKRGPTGEKGDAGLPTEAAGSKGMKGEQGPAGLAGPDADQKLCNYVLATDVLFILDTSSGVGQQNFNTMKVFMKNIIESFDVDNQLTRVGVMTYDVEARVDIRLNDYNNKDKLFQAIDRLVYYSGELTRIDRALVAANDYAYSEEFGGRNDVNRAIVLMTDGQQSYAPDQIDIPVAAKPLIDSGVLRYAIGIGNEISPVELEAIAGDNVVLAENFNQLLNKIETQIQLIGKRGCKGEDGPAGSKGRKGDSGLNGQRGERGETGLQGFVGPKGAKGLKGDRGESKGEGRKGQPGDVGDFGPPGLPGCYSDNNVQQNTVADLGFVVDASSSLYSQGFQTEINFVNNVIDAVGPISDDGVRVSVIVYSDMAALRIKFNDHFNSEDLKQAVSNLPFDDVGETRIDLGLAKANEMFDIENGARGSSKKVLILMTDGQQTYVPGIKDPSDIAKELSQYGIDILAVGIGEEIARIDLETYISKPENLFLASSFNQLVNQLVTEVTQALTCEGGPRGPDGAAGSDGDPGAQGLTGQEGAEGPRGYIGDPGYGPTGDKGEKGTRGPKGVEGSDGFRGPDGPVGERGLIGPKGSFGFKGMKGDGGIDGFMGLKGPQGPPGPKGSKGSTAGNTGAKGVQGDFGGQGPKGFPGDQATLAPGNTLDDWLGEEGGQGPPGERGPEGPKGTVKVAPGEKGSKGEEGVIGKAGSFASPGPQGPQGPQGFKGEPGEDGPKGDAGFRGLSGPKGRAGSDGDPGEVGGSRAGDGGEQGKPGPRGDEGEQGEIGFVGLSGLFGRKGDAGEAGPQGRQSQPDPTAPIRNKGQPGDIGPSGDFGEDGEQGPAGQVMPGPRGEQGNRGPNGPQGPKGEQGDDGPVGFGGFQGSDGPKGQTGADGDPGAVGRTGQPGERGAPTPKGYFGLDGDAGDFGLVGRPGNKGVSGAIGDIGPQGGEGDKGPRGKQGFAGLIGPPGKEGVNGESGPVGDRGLQGERGPNGPNGKIETGDSSGYYVVRHSQNSFVPACPRDYEVMWEGYSLMYTVGNGFAHSQDLGDAGSCSRSFSTLPFVFCGITNTCNYASRNDFTYWLSGDVRQPMMPVSNTAIEPFISRCAVCKTPDHSIAVHSQDLVTPPCPLGYESLWSGFSFLMVAAAGKTGAGQSLASTGSCLEEFRPKPFIECEGARGTCHFFSDKFSFWLITIDKSREFDPQTPVTLNKNKGDDLTSRVSRCRVCLRSPQRPGGGNIPEGFFGRVARSVGNWFA